MKAVILAAGMGSRLQTELNGLPKPLLKICGKSLIEATLDSLSNTKKITEVVIAVGYSREKIRDAIGTKYAGLKVSYSENNFYKETGSMHSLYLSLEKPCSCIVLDGDILFHPKIIEEILDSNKKNLTLLTKRSGRDDEVVVGLEKGDIVSLGKLKANHNSSEKVLLVGSHESTNKLFEFVGISKFSKSFIHKMFQLHNLYLSSGRFYEHCEYCACRAGAYIPWKGYIKEDLTWCEIDTPEDIPYAKKIFNDIKSKLENDN